MDWWDWWGAGAGHRAGGREQAGIVARARRVDHMRRAVT